MNEQAARIHMDLIVVDQVGRLKMQVFTLSVSFE